MANRIQTSVENFDRLPGTALVSIADAIVISGRSRNSIYRHFQRGELTPVKVGFSTRIRVADLRSLIGA